ncbi:hypothetical protein F2Q69_00024966 [Brassica cretica]|uniref:Uncharacterized protein n=1 Tax=Brassica cretica TaxID=69181 RepID=A0A8S9Q4H1_BRACR|nr:hypothetical protein F2Q69_00024966 [Brassica cretica]
MYSLECEAAVNEQVNSVFPRTQVWKKEITRDVDGVSAEKRGGRVQLEPMVIPQSEFDYADTGDVLMLSMIKLFHISQV